LSIVLSLPLQFVFPADRYPTYYLDDEETKRKGETERQRDQRTESQRNRKTQKERQTKKGRFRKTEREKGETE